MNDVTMPFIFKADMTAQIAAALSIVETVPARDCGEEIYRAGFRAALLAIAVTNGLNIPDLRNACADAKRRNRAVTVYDGRL